MDAVVKDCGGATSLETKDCVEGNGCCCPLAVLVGTEETVGAAAELPVVAGKDLSRLPGDVGGVRASVDWARSPLGKDGEATTTAADAATA